MKPKSECIKTKLGKCFCCEINCKIEAEWEVFFGNAPHDNTLSCDKHIGILVGDSNYFQAKRLAAEEKKRWATKKRRLKINKNILEIRKLVIMKDEEGWFLNYNKFNHESDIKISKELAGIIIKLQKWG